MAGLTELARSPVTAAVPDQHAQPRPAGTHPAAPAGQRRVHSAAGGRAAARHRVNDRRLLDEFRPTAWTIHLGFAFPLPIAVIGELLGVPAGRSTQFQHLARDWTQVLDVTTPRILARADAAAAEIRGYLSDLARCSGAGDRTTTCSAR